jgi:hypothetical protein
MLGSIILGVILKAPKAVHLLATMRVLRFRYGRPSLSIQDAHDAVKELATRLGKGEPPRDADLVLEETLRRATGIGARELAQFAEDWPRSAQGATLKGSAKQSPTARAGTTRSQ